MTTAARLMAACRAPTETAPSSMAFRSLESPAWSRVRSRFRASAPGLTPEAVSQGRPGRTMSAQTARISPMDSSSIRLPA